MCRTPEQESQGDRYGRKGKRIGDAAYEPLQTAGSVPLVDEDEEEFEFIARKYKVEGDTPERLCTWNRNVRPRLPEISDWAD
jgi:hypothetical protein